MRGARARANVRVVRDRFAQCDFLVGIIMPATRSTGHFSPALNRYHDYNDYAALAYDYNRYNNNDDDDDDDDNDGSINNDQPTWRSPTIDLSTHKGLCQFSSSTFFYHLWKLQK